MSKKKAFSGSTMTLKDFHGGSIPTDLPLPSAPGVTVTPTDRSSYAMARPDNRARPRSSPSTRHFDDKPPFLAHPRNIGRNFDEDERKPLYGVSASQRTVTDESFHVSSSHLELKSESVSTGRVSNWRGSGSSGAMNSYADRVAEQSHVGVNSLNSVGSSDQVDPMSNPNAWTVRRGVTTGVIEPVQSGVDDQSAASKLAHASALEKVSSGRWQTKHSVQYHADAEIAQHPEADSGLLPKSYGDNLPNRTYATGGGQFPDATLARHMERGLNIDEGFRGGKKEDLDHERTISSTYLGLKEWKPGYNVDRVQSAYSNGKSGGSDSLPSLLSEASERPKLKLLPRTKPLEGLKPDGATPNQGCQHSSDHGHVEAVNILHEDLMPTKPRSPGIDGADDAVDRPKLILKPRLQAAEQLVVNTETERKALFGGARPRELVLRERGIDDVAINNHDSSPHSDKAKQNLSKTKRVTEKSSAARQGERTENLPLDQRKFDRKDQRVDVERADTQRRNWHNDNRRKNKGTAWEQQQQEEERHPSPETWRKPVDQFKPASVDGAGARYGKVASAVELAQAFSRSFSDPKLDDRYSGQRGHPVHGQTRFSRLTCPTSRAGINGY